jgi:hypothetical protein
MKVFSRIRSAVRAFLQEPGTPTGGYDPWKHDSQKYVHERSLYRKALGSPRALKKLIQASVIEDETNPWYAGILSRLAQDSVGAVPLLVVDLPNLSSEISDRIEDQWLKWAQEIRLGSKLRMIRRATSRS